MKAITILIICLFTACSSAPKTPIQTVDCWSYIGKAIEYREQKQYDAALKQIELHNQCDKSDVKMSYFYHLGWTYHEMHDYKKAVTAYTNGLKTQPDFVFAYWRRGLAYEELNQLDLAKADYARAYELGMKNDPQKFSEFLKNNPEIHKKLLVK